MIEKQGSLRLPRRFCRVRTRVVRESYFQLLPVRGLTPMEDRSRDPGG